MGRLSVPLFYFDVNDGVHKNLQKESVRTRYRSISIICLALRLINVIAFVLNLGVLDWKVVHAFFYFI